jgi:subtilisin family serine protease
LLPGVLLAAAVFASDARVDPRIFAGKTAGETASFLVVMREQADLSGAEALPKKAEKGRFVYEALAAQAEASQAALRAELDARGIAYRSFYLVNMLEIEGPRSLAGELASRPDVSSVAANREVHLEPQPVVEPELSPSASDLPPAAAATVEANIAKIGAPDVWSRGFTGQGIVVGMADTGIAWEHPALKNHYRGFDGTNVSHDYNWHDAIHNAVATNPCHSDTQSPCDDDGHGTATASLAVGDDGAGNQIGAAPGARFIGCRNMDQGNGTPARYTECFQFLMAPTDHSGANPRPDLAAHVINGSWGCPASEGCTDPNVLRAIIENVRAAGIVVVVSAGNSGSACSTISDPPAFYDAAFCVGATTNSDAIASFSSRGPITADGSNRLKPDITAPGVNARVARPDGTYATGFTGTSGSAPHVTGAVALLFSAAPGFVGHVSETIDLLERTATPLTSTQDCGGLSGSSVPNPVFGFGRVNVAAAVNRAVPPARPKAVLSPRHGGTRQIAPRKNL